MAITQTLALCAGVGVLIVAATFLIPSKVHVERTALIPASPDRILEIAASNVGYQDFNPYLDTDPDLKLTHFGPASGVGSGFSFDGKEGKGTQTVAHVASDHVIYDIDLGKMGTPTQTLRVEAADGGTHVTWSMDADMGHNPVSRVFGLFMDKFMGKTFEAGLQNLANATT